MYIKSPAKINLSLKITGTREDGYHLLEMVNLPIDLHDVIEIEELPHGGDTYVTCDEFHLAGLHSNLCQKAVIAMRERFGFKQNYRIHIHKEIPFAAGLGGGSSNAASVMLALNKLLRLNAPMDVLKEIALSLGSDVPFFLNPKPSLVTGIGETIRPIAVKKDYHVLVVQPPKGLSTKEVYAACDASKREEIDTAKVVDALRLGDDDGILNGRGNDLYPAACELYPEVRLFVEDLKKIFPLAAMSGSGSSVFALTSDGKAAKDAYHKMDKAGYNVFLCKVIK